MNKLQRISTRDSSLVEDYSADEIVCNKPANKGCDPNERQQPPLEKLKALRWKISLQPLFARPEWAWVDEVLNAKDACSSPPKTSNSFSPGEARDRSTQEFIRGYNAFNAAGR